MAVEKFYPFNSSPGSALRAAGEKPREKRAAMSGSKCVVSFQQGLHLYPIPATMGALIHGMCQRIAIAVPSQRDCTSSQK